MDISQKVIKILILFIVIFLWNKFVVKILLKQSIALHKKVNAQKLDKQPIKFLIENEKNIYNFAVWFYWIGFVFISLNILLKE